MKIGPDSDFLFVLSEAEFKRQVGRAIDEALNGYDKQTIISQMVTDLIIYGEHAGTIGGNAA